jgi:hypothetical protein
MNQRARYVLSGALVLVMAGAGCAGARKQARESPSPVTRQVELSQTRTEEALKGAQEAQDRATTQARKAAAAEDVVRQDQEKLAQDQLTARQEQAKAQQLQREATRDASWQPPRWAQALATGVAAADAAERPREGRGRGRAGAPGRGDDPTPGHAMSFRVSDRTQVWIEGRKASADQIREGSEARVSYEASNEGPSAVSISVGRPGDTRSR